jgi:uncharacterized membrane protein YfcA
MKMDINNILFLVLIGLSAGILSGLVGVGGGIIMVPLLIIMGFSQHQAQGTSLAVLALPVTFIAAYNYQKAGHLDWKVALVIALFFIVGAYFGSKIAINIDQKMLKKIFGVTLLILSLRLIFSK